MFLGMVREPTVEIEITSWVESVWMDSITVEVIRDYGLKNRMGNHSDT